MERIRIRMEAYDHEILDQSAAELVNKAKETGARVSGPIPPPLASSATRFCVVPTSTRSRAISSRCAPTSA